MKYKKDLTQAKKSYERARPNKDAEKTLKRLHREDIIDLETSQVKPLKYFLANNPSWLPSIIVSVFSQTHCIWTYEHRYKYNKVSVNLREVCLH